MIRRNDRVAQREVQALRADRRQGVGRVAEEEHAGRAPARHAVGDDVEQERMADRAAVRAQVGGEVGRHVRRHLLDPLRDAAPAELAEAALQDRPADLELVAEGAVGEEQMAAARVGARAVEARRARGACTRRRPSAARSGAP